MPIWGFDGYLGKKFLKKAPFSTDVFPSQTVKFILSKTKNERSVPLFDVIDGCPKLLLVALDMDVSCQSSSSPSLNQKFGFTFQLFTSSICSSSSSVGALPEISS